MSDQYEKGYFCNNCRHVWKENMDECPCGMPNLVAIKVKTLPDGTAQMIGFWDEEEIKPDLENEMLDKMHEQVQEVLQEPVQKMKVKLGERFKWKESRAVETCLAGSKLDIKPGDECYIVMMGNEVPAFNFLTGNLAGKTLLMNENEKEDFIIEGYDTHSIASMLMNRIGWHCGVDEALEEFEIDKERCISEMEEMLDEILYWRKEKSE
jgi:hypothetical protein